MAGKVLMTWDITPEKEGDYFEFVVKEFIPGIQKLGFEMSDAWVTVYGDRPQILVGATLPTIQAVHDVLGTPRWQALLDRLQAYVTNFTCRVVKSTGAFQF